MRMYNDCVPCIVRQSLEAARFATSDERVHQKILKLALKKLAEIDFCQSPPVMARYMQEIIKNITGNNDPYKGVKKKYNDFALNIYPDLQKKVEDSSSPLETALCLAIAGNIIDFGVSSSIGESKVLATIDHALSSEVYGDMKYLQEVLKESKNILWIADNTGEIVFDRLALEIIGLEKITFAVRGAPILNDATMEDAVYTGISDMVKVIDNGTDIPGTVLKECSKEFNKAFENSDLIISKGQGNYETLPHDDKRIFFLFKAKCTIVADLAGCTLGDMVVASC
ncbi:MAG: ARMT1-like domain-containing protein [Thermodesulfobacteriota bacterium]|nr:ARMT1-like domain-containing protein [Thermodesulfobacteriota bacterium]